MNRALKLAIAAAAAVLIMAYAAMRGGPSDAAIPTMATSSERVDAVHAIHRDARNMFMETRDWPTAIHAGGEFELEGLTSGYRDIAPTADGLTLANLRSFGASPPVRVDFAMRGDALLRGRVALGSQVVEVPDRDVCEVTLNP